MALEKQMELFEEGGLMQEGGTVDEESGNDVPVGSLKKEVRDDIPAQLSEGEFVMPADVVRFHGLDKMMALRDEAKMGLQRMEDMGQMGNADEATIPDGVPFSMDDLDIEDEPVEMQQGGFVPLPSPPMPNPPFPFPIPQPEYGTTFTPGGTRGSSFGQREPQYNQYQVPTYGGYQPPQPQAVPTAPTGLPSFSDFVTPKYELYVNDAGNTISIPVDANGNPLIPVPAGYKKQSDTTAIAGPAPDPAQQQTQVAPTLTQQDDPTSPEDLASQQEAQQRIEQRKDAAKKLGYTKEANALEGLVGALIPGAGLFGIGKNQEAGTIMPDGTISDGQGNTFDPITGKQMGGKGFLGLGKSEAEKFGLSEQIPESSFAGLRSMAGEESIQDVIGKIDLPAEEKAPTDVGVETARVTETADTTAAQAVESRLEASKTDIEKRMNDLGLKGNQRKDFLNAIINQEETSIRFAPGQGFTLTGEKPVTVDFTPATSIAQAQAQTGAAQRLLDEQIDRERQTGRDVLTTLDVKPTREPARFAPIDTEGVVEEETRIQQTRVARNQRIQKEAEEQTQNYRNRGYTETAAKQAGQNKARADDEAREQTGEPQAKAVTDKYGNAVRSGSDGSVVTSNREQKDDGPEPDSRWCCSQMVHRGLWTQQHEFARLTVWSSKQPDWWKSGYHVWGKVLAKTFLRKKGFWTDVMQSFYDYHIRKKPYTWRTAIAHAMVYPGVFICGNIWTKQPKGVTLASFKELNG